MRTLLIPALLLAICISAFAGGVYGLRLEYMPDLSSLEYSNDGQALHFKSTPLGAAAEFLFPAPLTFGKDFTAKNLWGLGIGAMSMNTDGDDKTTCIYGYFNKPFGTPIYKAFGCLATAGVGFGYLTNERKVGTISKYSVGFYWTFVEMRYGIITANFNEDSFHKYRASSFWTIALSGYITK